MTPDSEGGSDALTGGASDDWRRALGSPVLLNAWTGGAAGVGVTAGLASQDAFWPALTVLAGAIVASGLLLARRGGHKRYLLAGIAYCLGLAVVLELGGARFPDAYTTTVLSAVGGFGAIGGLLVVAKVAGKRVVKTVARLTAADEAYWAQVWEALAAFGSLLSMAWLLVTFTEKVVRYVGVSVGAVALLVANMLDYRVPIQVFGVEAEAVMVLFVGCVLMWFHLLDTLHNSWRAAVHSAEKTREPSGQSTDGESTSGMES